MNKNIPIENDGNNGKLRDNDENIQYEGYFRVESANLWERNTINMITIIAGLLTILNNLNYTVYSRKYNHKNQLQKHHLNEIEVEPNRLVHFIDI